MEDDPSAGSELAFSLPGVPGKPLVDLSDTSALLSELDDEITGERSTA